MNNTLNKKAVTIGIILIFLRFIPMFISCLGLGCIIIPLLDPVSGIITIVINYLLGITSYTTFYIVLTAVNGFLLYLFFITAKNWQNLYSRIIYYLLIIFIIFCPFLSFLNIIDINKIDRSVRSYISIMKIRIGYMLFPSSESQLHSDIQMHPTNSANWPS